jgi:hypothetical protein
MSKYGPRVYKPAIGVHYNNHLNSGGEWYLKGKKDTVYTVRMTEKGFTCDCPGMTYRGKCRHTVEIAAAIDLIVS